MKSILMLVVFGMMFGSTIHAKPQNNAHFGYGSAGTIGGHPVVGGGYRTHSGHHGVDVSARAFPLPSVPVGEARALYLHYPKQHGLYVGAGPGYIHETENFRHGSLTADAVLGYEWKTAKGRNLFLQAEALTPFKDVSSRSAKVWPAVTLGIKF